MAIAFHKAWAPGPWGEFVRHVEERLRTLHRESSGRGVVLPIGILLVVDRAHGGDDTADEIIRRFPLLDRESQNWIDFYYLGWKESGRKMRFNLNWFSGGRDALRRIGVKEFGGNADLILVDTSISPRGRRTFIHFETAIRIDLSKERSSGGLVPLGAFLQAVIDAAEEVKQEAISGPPDNAVYKISDTLGLMYARESFLDFILDKWGKFFGAKRLKSLAVRKLGPKVTLSKLERAI